MLDRIKTLLSITDTLQDKLLSELIGNTEIQLLNAINDEVVPKKLEYMIVEYVVYRFQLLGNEATKSEKIFEQSANYENYTFKEYFKSDLSDYISSNKLNRRGTITTLF